MDDNCVLLDTSFHIRLLNDQDPLHKNVLGFYQYFLEKEIRLKCSTISIAEYCVRGKIEELPLKNLEIIPFNITHAVKAGEFANIVFTHKNTLNLGNRLIIPNDNKLFAQAHTEKEITRFATSDVECIKIYELLKQNFVLDFEIINIRNPYTNELGTLF
jgi:hypothetical protein